MNLIRCKQCGNDISSSGGPTAFVSKCPHCGTPTLAPSSERAETSPTIVTRGAPLTAHNPQFGENAQPDTDPGLLNAPTLDVGNFVLPPRVTGSAPRPVSRELVDFLMPALQPDELGRLGGYRILRVLGAGGMGVVYEAEDMALQRRVAIKAMLPTLAVSETARQRFLREARSAAAVSHERIVPIFQVGEDRGVPFLVMPLLKGEPLDARLSRERRIPLSETLRIGREIAEALAEAHERGLVHRDIKPGNIWLESPRAKVKLLDFGLARAAEADTPLTQQGSIVGTPSFMAPEQASGENLDGRCDLFSLGCILYRMATGTLAFDEPTAIATLVAIMTREPLPPLEANADVPPALSKLIMQLLAKKPADRPASARAVVEAMDAIKSAPTPRQAGPLTEKIETVPLRPQVGPPNPPRRTGIWAAGIGLVAVLILGAGAWFIAPLLKREQPVPATNPPLVPSGPIEIGVTYGSEKQGWFKEAVVDFAATPEGKDIKINLIPMGSLEGAQAVVNENKNIHVWAPASSLYRATFDHDWKIKNAGKSPFLKTEPIALTPMVFVLWKDRHEALATKYPALTLPILADAMKRSWGELGGKPEWGRFRFGLTNPGQSNSGLITLVLMACQLNHDRPLTLKDVHDADFQTKLADFKRGLAGTSNSTGNLMKDMVTKGPSAFDALMVYESLVIDYLKAARGRWGDLRVVYPPDNLWNDNPYCILDVPWSSKEHRQAADQFLTYLLGEAQQRKALAHGFRPVNINIPITDDPQSPFVLYKASGLIVNVGSICESPSREVVDELLRVWERAK